MIVHPCESPRVFPTIRGELVLIDPNGHQIAQVKNAELKEYLVSHNLCCEEDLRQTPQMPEQFRYVFDARYKKILDRSDDLPKVSLPLLSSTGRFVELNSYSDVYSADRMRDILLNRLEIALTIYPYVAYSARTVESELIGIGQKWREWFLNDIVGRMARVQIALPVGVYPGLHGSVVCRENAGRIDDFLNEIPRQHWRDWAPKDVFKQIYL